MGRIDKEIRVIKTLSGLPATSPPSPNGSGPSALAVPRGGFARGAIGTGNIITTFEYDLLNRKRTIVYLCDPRTRTSITAKYNYSSMGEQTSPPAPLPKGEGSILSGSDAINLASTTDDISGTKLINLVTYTASNNQTRKLQDVSYTFKIDNSISSTLNTPDIDTNGGYLSTVRYNYKYDGLNRLVKAAGLYTKSSMPNSGTQDIVNRFESGFQYAPNGNMTGRDILDPATHSVQESLTYAYGGNNHAVTGITSSLTGERYRMSYDAVGNMTLQSGPQAPQTPLEGGLTAKAMEYDSYNRITKVTNPDAGNEVVGQYWYDDQAGNLTSMSFPALPTSCGSGFRVRKLAKRKVAGEDRQVEVLYPSMYFGLEKHRTTAGTEIPNTTYAVNNIYLDGVRIAAVIPNGDARYYFTDQVDSVKVVADDNGRAVTRMEYMPYGDTWFTEGDNNNSPKYNSQELDKESNFYYYNARHYDAGVARFVTADTVIDGEFDTQGWNRYAYCHNNPIRYKDPSGHGILDFLSSIFETKMGNDEMKPSSKSSSKELKETSDSLKQDGKTINELVDKALNNVSDKKTANGTKIGKDVVDNVSKQACLAASYYELLKASKVDNLEKTFNDFLKNQIKSENIDKNSAFVNDGNKIVSSYTKDGRALRLGSIQVETDKKNQVLDKDEQKEKYQQYLHRTNKTDVGIVSITNPHSMLEYKNDKNEKVITDTAQREHGSSSSKHVNEGNFRAYYWLEYDDKKKK